jgi:catechol 2,3-dioxygenase-like lactoylglutathione lyase family enzyme
VYPIGETDTTALPVRELGPAIGYYTQVLGFEVVKRNDRSATLRRDRVEIGLAVSAADPEQASCYFDVEGVQALYRELEGKGIAPSAVSENVHEGRRQHIFFAKEPYGVCFCFGSRQSEAE